MRVAFLDTIVFDKFLISPKLYMFIIRYPTSSVDISLLIIYYTDFCDVDEGMMTIAGCGGEWVAYSQAGLARRNLWDSPFTISSYVS